MSTSPLIIKKFHH